MKTICIANHKGGCAKTTTVLNLASVLEANTERVRQRLSPLMLVAADGELLAVCAAEGLATDDPNNHSKFLENWL